MRPTARLVVALCLVLSVGVAAAWAQGAPPSVGLVSPGGSSITTKTSGCTTFSWAPGDSVASYELAVFELDAARQPKSAPLLHIPLNGRASSWTPSASECLKAGQDFLWSMREIKRAGDKPGKWSEGLTFTVSSTTDTKVTEANADTDAKVTAQAQGDNGNGNGNGGGGTTANNPNAEILERLTAIEARLAALANPGFRQETCFELGAEGELGVEGEGRAYVNLNALVGAIVFGNGAAAVAEGKGGVKVAGGAKGSLGIKRTGCWDSLVLNPSAAATASAPAAAPLTGDEIKNLLSSVSNQLQLTDDRIRSGLTALPTLGSNTDILSSLKSGGPLAALANVLPVPEHVRNLANDPGQIIENFKAQLNLCAKTDLPPALAQVVGDFCQLKNTERFGPLLDRVDGVVSTIRNTTNATQIVTNATQAVTNAINGTVGAINTAVGRVESTINSVKNTVDNICIFACGGLK